MTSDTLRFFLLFAPEPFFFFLLDISSTAASLEFRGSIDLTFDPSDRFSCQRSLTSADWLSTMLFVRNSTPRKCFPFFRLCLCLPYAPFSIAFVDKSLPRSIKNLGIT